MDEDTPSADEDVHPWMRFIHRWCATHSRDNIIAGQIFGINLVLLNGPQSLYRPLGL